MGAIITYFSLHTRRLGKLALLLSDKSENKTMNGYGIKGILKQCCQMLSVFKVGHTGYKYQLTD